MKEITILFFCVLIAFLIVLRAYNRNTDLRFVEKTTILKSLLNGSTASKGSYLAITAFLSEIICYGENQKRQMDEIVEMYKVKFAKYIN
jgi:hypothetical protein